jgi:hypothetical protein
MKKFRVDVIDMDTSYVPLSVSVLADTPMAAAAKAMSFDFDKSGTRAFRAGDTAELRVRVWLHGGGDVQEFRLVSVTCEPKPSAGRFAHPDDYGKAVKKWKDGVMALLDKA